MQYSTLKGKPNTLGQPNNPFFNSPQPARQKSSRRYSFYMSTCSCLYTVKPRLNQHDTVQYGRPLQVEQPSLYDSKMSEGMPRNNFSRLAWPSDTTEDAAAGRLATCGAAAGRRNAGFFFCGFFTFFVAGLFCTDPVEPFCLSNSVLKA